jgi:hypothetical protein
MAEAEVSGISVREIPGYVNSMGKNTAMIEKLSCGHEFVDGKFNVDTLYFSAPRQPEKIVAHTSVAPSVPNNEIHYIPRPVKKNGIRVMDVACMICMVFLAFTCPPLVILPALYFIGRIK